MNIYMTQGRPRRQALPNESRHLTRGEALMVLGIAAAPVWFWLFVALSSYIFQ